MVANSHEIQLDSPEVHIQRAMRLTEAKQAPTKDKAETDPSLDNVDTDSTNFAEYDEFSSRIGEWENLPATVRNKALTMDEFIVDPQGEIPIGDKNASNVRNKIYGDLYRMLVIRQGDRLKPVSTSAIFKELHVIYYNSLEDSQITAFEENNAGAEFYQALARSPHVRALVNLIKAQLPSSRLVDFETDVNEIFNQASGPQELQTFLNKYLDYSSLEAKPIYEGVVRTIRETMDKGQKLDQATTDYSSSATNLFQGWMGFLLDSKHLSLTYIPLVIGAARKIFSFWDTTADISKGLGYFSGGAVREVFRNAREANIAKGLTRPLLRAVVASPVLKRLAGGLAFSLVGISMNFPLHLAILGICWITMNWAKNPQFKESVNTALGPVDDFAYKHLIEEPGNALVRGWS